MRIRVSLVARHSRMLPAGLLRHGCHSEQAPSERLAVRAAGLPRVVQRFCFAFARHSRVLLAGIQRLWFEFAHHSHILLAGVLRLCYENAKSLDSRLRGNDEPRLSRP